MWSGLCKTGIWKFDFRHFLWRIEAKSWTASCMVVGPALIAVLSRALSLIATRVQIPVGACEKVAIDLGLGGGFRRVCR